MLALPGMRQRNRRKGAPRGPRFRLPEVDWPRIAVLSGFVVATAAVLGLLAHALDRPVQRVEVEGRFQRVSPLEIEQAVVPFASQGFLSVDLQGVRTSLESIGWVDRVQVERSWPDGLKVYVTEQVPAARWGVDGLLNTRGELFLRDVRRVPPELPLLQGPEGSEAEVARLYLDTFPRLLAVGMRLTGVALDARGAWELSLENGIDVRLGRQDVAERLERFINVASPLVATRAPDIAYVDLRYSNGFSVGWKADADPDDMMRDASGPARVVSSIKDQQPDA